jgi:hypothetical protein
MADQRAHDRPVLLLHLRAIVLVIGAAPREGQSGPVAGVQQRAIDELGAVVGIQAAERHGQAPSNLMDGALDAGEVLAPQRVELHPAGRDVDGAQRIEKEGPGGRPAVRDQIDFQEARLGVIPLGKRPNGDLVLEPGAGPGGAGAAPRPMGARRGEQSLERGEAGLAEQRGCRRRGVHLAEGHEPSQQLPDKGMETLGTDLAGRFPHHRGHLGDGGTITPRTPDWTSAWGAPPIAPQVPNDRLAVIARDGGDLVQQARALGPRAERIPRPLSG